MRPRANRMWQCVLVDRASVKNNTLRGMSFMAVVLLASIVAPRSEATARLKPLCRETTQSHVSIP
eukprot:6598138-Pyramimonas_sp.AAC.1